jgi:hypothetical protein
MTLGIGIKSLCQSWSPEHTDEEVAMEEPDYTTLSLNALYGIRSHIDRVRYPERFERLEKEIARRDAERRDSREDVKCYPTRDSLTKSKAWAPIIGCTVLAFAAFTLALAVTVLKFSSSFTKKEVFQAFSSSAVINEALAEAYPGEEISASVLLSEQRGHTVEVTLTNSELSQLVESERRDSAQEIALVAYCSDPEQAQLSGVRVVFHKERVIPLLIRISDARDNFFFETGDLSCVSSPLGDWCPNTADPEPKRNSQEQS